MKYIFTILLFLLLVKIDGQTLKQGEYEFGLLEWEIIKTDSIEVDSSHYLRMVKEIKAEIEMSIAFKKDTSVILKFDEYGDEVKRNVYCEEEGVFYNFLNMKGIKTYDHDTLSKKELHELLGLYKNQIISEEEEVQWFFNFECKKINAKFNDAMELEVIITKKMIKPALRLVQFGFEGLLLRATFEIKGLKVTMGIKSYSNEILHPEWFSTATKKYINRRNLFSPDEDEEEFVVKNISLDKKKEFIQYLKESKAVYDITETQIEAIAKEILEKEFKGLLELVTKIPRASIILSNINFPDIKIDAQKNTFRDVFPVWDEFLKGDFNATNLHLIDKNYIAFEYKEESYRVFKSNEAILKRITKLLREKGSSNYDLYSIFNLSISRRVYYYLTLQQKKELQNLFDIRFVPWFRDED